MEGPENPKRPTINTQPHTTINKNMIGMSKHCETFKGVLTRMK